MKDSLFNKQIELPKFSKKTLLSTILMVVICNVVFWVLAFLTKTARPIINVDYLLALILFCLPYKTAKILGVLVFFMAIVIDVIMFTMQLFPFMDLSGFIYFLPFIKVAPTLYQVMALVVVALLLFFPFLLIKLSKKTNLYHLLILIVPMSILGYFTQHLQYHHQELQKEMFGANNFYYIASQFRLYQFNKGHAFLESAGDLPAFLPYKKEYASQSLKNSPKILFITSESWGRFNNDELHNQIIADLLKNQERFEFFYQGYFPYQDATVNGELRELCQLQVQGFAFRKMQDELKDCLPNRLKNQGYTTIGLHGGSGGLYERYVWYPKAGFKIPIFAENLMDKRICQPFRGVCDTQLFELVRESFVKNDKVFFYWLTLTSHYPYDLKDLIQSSTLSCQQYGIEDNHPYCHNAKLHQQFFYYLNELIQDPAMRGVEVMVVGDHVPPTQVMLDPVKYLKDNSVAWVHFKVK